MATKIESFIKLQIEGGKANPSPPVGPALGQHGVNIMDFVKLLMRKHRIKLESYSVESQFTLTGHLLLLQKHLLFHH